MTIEALLECSADQLEAMTNEQLEEWFRPLLTITRPDLAIKETIKKPVGLSSKNQLELERQAKAIEIAAGMGIDIGDLFK